MSTAEDTSAPPEPFDCPRCGTNVTERLWGPCESCRADLRATYGGAGRAAGEQVERQAYVPKMNVTPNAVALKDD